MQTDRNLEFKIGYNFFLWLLQLSVEIVLIL